MENREQLIQPEHTRVMLLPTRKAELPKMLQSLPEVLP